MSATDLIILALAALYAAHAIGWSYGPFHIFKTLRARLPLGGLTDCTFCLSFWAAAAFYLLWQTDARPFVYIVAAAGAAVAIASYTGVGGS